MKLKFLHVLLPLLLMFSTALGIDLNAQTTSVDIGSGSAVTNVFPFNNFYKNSYNQMIYYKSEVGAAGYIGAISFEKSGFDTRMFQEVTIWMGLTSDSVMTTSSWVPADSLHQVLHLTDYDVPSEQGPLMLTLDSSFYYDGNHNLVIVVARRDDGYNSSIKFKYTPTPANSCIYRRSDSDASVANHPGTVTGTTSSERPNLTLYTNTVNSFCFPLTSVSISSLTENSISATWAEGLSSNGFEVAILDTVTEGSDLSTVTPYSVTDNNYTFDNLMPNTVYMIAVRKICDGNTYSDWTVTYARTTPVAQMLPFICGFEEATSRDSWVLDNGIYLNRWVIDTGASYGDESRYGLYITNDDSHTNEYTIGSNAGIVYAKTLLNFPTAGEYNVGFDWKCMGESSWDFMRALLVPAASIDQLVPSNVLPSGLNDHTTPGYAIALDGNYRLNGSSAWSRHMNVVDIIDPGNYYLVFVWRNDGSGGAMPPAAVDNVIVEHATCQGVDSVVVDNITSTTATINGYSSSGNSFILCYAEWSSDHYDTIPIFSPYTIEDLRPGTYYKGILRSNCGPDGVSYSSAEFQFGTECAEITLPWAYGAESTFMQHASGNERYPYCWENINGASSTYYWKYDDGSYAHTGEYGLYFYGTSATSTTHDDWLITPTITFTGSEQMSFWVKTTTATETSQYQGRFALYASNDNATDISDTANYDMLTISGIGTSNNVVEFAGNEWQHITITLPNTLVGSHHLAFVIKDINSFNFCLDDIYLYTATSCAMPQNVALTGISSSSATISWIGDAASYDVYYGEPGFSMDTASSVVASTNTALISGLSPNTTYECRIVASCASGVSSSPSYPLLFTTTCSPIPMEALPFVEDFSDNAIGTTAPLDDCWNKGTNSVTQYPYVTSSESCGNPNSLYFYSSSSYYCYVALPAFELDVSDLVLSCSVRRYTSASYTSDLIIGLCSNPYDIATFTAYDTLSPETLGEWTNFLVSLSQWNSEDGAFITFLLPSGETGYSHLDNIQVTARGACDSPSDPIVNSITATEASVSWTDTVASHWMVYYGEPGFSIDTAISFTADTTTAVINGLNPQTTYEFVVAADCGDGSYSAPSLPAQFTTACAPIANLPYFEDFESYSTGSSADISPCWYKHAIGTTINYPYPYGVAAIHGSRGLYFYAYESSSTHYNCYAVLPMFDTALVHLKLKFYMENEMESLSTYNYYSKMALGVMGNPHDLATFDTLAIYDMSQFPTGTIHQYEYTFEDYQGTGQYIAMLALDVDRESLSYAENAFYIDDVEVALIPSCHRPSQLTATTTATTADLSWIGNAASYEVMYSQSEDMSDSTIVTATSNSIQLTGLTPYTYYYINVRGVCSATENSEWMLMPHRIRTAMDCGEGYQNFVDTIGDGTTNVNTYVLNTSSTQHHATNWSIYTHDELTQMGLVGNANIIKSISLHAEDAGSPVAFRVYMSETDVHEFTSTMGDTIPLSQMTMVYDGTMLFEQNAWNEILLQTPFTYSDTANLMIAFERPGELSSPTFFYYTTNPEYRTVYQYATNSNSNLSHYRNKGRGNIAFNICGDIPSCVRPYHVVNTSITSNTISLSWSGSSSSYEAFYDEVDFNPATSSSALSATTTTNSITLQNLNENTTYHIYLRSVCGAEHSIWTGPIVLTTPCNPIDLPYSENFDSYPASTSVPDGQTLDPCWTKGTSNLSSAYPYIYASNSYSSPNSMRFYGSSSQYCYAALPMFTEPVNNTAMSFKLYKTSSNYGMLYVGVMVDPSDISTFQSIAKVQPSENYEWESFEVNFNTYTGEGHFLAFYMPDSISSYVQLDDIEVYPIPTCRAPIDVHVDSITTTRAVVSWTDVETAPAGGYQLEYGPTGFTLGTGTRISSSTNPTAINNLLVGTSYDVYVRAICANNDEGRWSFVKSFYTSCGAMALPLFYDFEGEQTGASANIPHCFSHYNNSVSEYDQNYPYVNSSAANAHSGSKYLYFYISSSSTFADNTAMIFPAIDTINYPMSGNQMVFWGKSGTTPSKIMVGVMSNVANFATFTAIDTLSLTPEYAEFTVDFSSYTGTGVYPALASYRPTSSTYAYIDDVVIEQSPSCPRVYDLHVVSATQNSATLGWTDTINSTQWVVDYRAEDATTMQSVTVATNPYTLTGLMPTTKYYFNVRPICESGDTSLPTRHEVSFWTSQVPATIPYAYDFENATEWNNWQTNSNCDINWYRGNAVAGQGSHSMYISTNAGSTRSSQWNRVVNAVAYRDIDFGADTSSFTMTFKASAGGTIEHNYDGISICLVDPFEDVVATNDNITTPWGHVNDLSIRTIRRDTNWTTYNVHFEQISGVHRVVFYWFNQNTGDNHPYINKAGAVDSITIVEQTCLRPYNLHATNIEATSVTLNWEGSATSYEVAYRSIDQADADTIYLTSTTNAINVTGLTSSTDYAYRVRAICSDSDTSYWSDNQYFKTICERYLAADTIREDFSQVPGASYSQDGYLPDCWEGWTNGTNERLPHVVNEGTYWYSHGDKSLIMTCGSAAYGNQAVVRLPYTVEPVNALTLSYWVCTESAVNGFLEVGYLTGSNFETDFVAVKTIAASDQTVHSGSGPQVAGIGLYDTISFEDAPANAQALAFRWNYTTSFYSVCLDDIVVTAEVSCYAPQVASIATSHDQATLTWIGDAPSYQLLYREANASAWNDTIDVTGTTYTLTHLLPETEYLVSLRALCGTEHGNSVWVDTTFTTDDLPCYTPTNVAVSNIGYEGATLEWTSEESSVQWVIHVFNGMDNIFDTVDVHPATITGLYAGIEYSVAVQSLCSEVVASDWSDTITFTTQVCPGATNVTASDITTNSALITWDSPDALKWEINYGYQIAVGEGEFREVTQRTYRITNLEPETPYDVYVRLYCTENTYGQWSEQLTFTTADENPQGINGIEGNYSLSIYPNPTNATTTISLTGIDGKVAISIVDMNGRTIATESIECGSDCEKQIDVTGLAQGTYFVRVLGDNINSVRKLIIR